MIERALILGEIWVIFCGLISGFSFVQKDVALFKSLLLDFLIPLITIFISIFISLIWPNSLGEKFAFGCSAIIVLLGFVYAFAILQGYLIVLTSKRIIKRK